MANQPYDALIDQFADSLWLSDGLSKNTIESYRRDMVQLDRWLAQLRNLWVRKAIIL